MQHLAKLCRNKAGNILVIAAVSLPLFVGAAGLATDTIMWTLWKREAQRAADSAAMAGALTVQQARVQAEKAAVHDFKRSVAFQELKGQIKFENAPKDGPYMNDDNAVRVNISIKQQLPFSSLFMDAPMTIEVYATATMAAGQENCLVALDPAGSGAVTVDGNAELALKCGIMSNSSSSAAVSVGGTAIVRATTVAAVGGIPKSNNYAAGIVFKEHAPPMVDPFRDLPDAKAPSTCNAKLSVPASQVRTVLPGCYEGMEIQGNVTFSPGVYYVTAADLILAAQSIVSGNGVTFILTNKSATAYFPQLLIAGGASVKLHAPTDGIYKGVLFYQSRNAPTIIPRPTGAGANFIAGNSGSVFGGSFYFPKQHVRITGGSGIDITCFKVVGYQLRFTGGGQAVDTCPTRTPSLSQRQVRLVA